MNPMLSGTSWGEIQTEENELNIPYFMTVDWKRMERCIAEAEEARRAAAIGAERRKLRRKAKAERNGRIGIIGIVMFVGFLSFCGWLLNVI